MLEGRDLRGRDLGHTGFHSVRGNVLCGSRFCGSHYCGNWFGEIHLSCFYMILIRRIAEVASILILLGHNLHLVVEGPTLAICHLNFPLQFVYFVVDGFDSLLFVVE